MSNRTISWFILVFTLLEFVVKTQLTAYDGSHGFISSKHERYLVDDISSMHEELAAETRSSAINLNMNYLLRFEPEYLDFKQRPLGVPHLEKVTLFNIDSNRTIDMTSISGSTVHFHSSFFEDKKIPPLGNTTFNVVFLGREEGPIESNLFIHTTEGHFQYQVKGASVYSPYRLRPIVGIKLPLNSSFSPLIYMHNPHPEPIQIVEMYSSGGDFHLELPTGELEGPKDMWEIPPLETKAVIRVRFHSRTEQNHTAYVRIKLNNTEEILVVPLEVEVTVNGGIFAPQGSVDFGVGGSLDPPKQIKLFLHNPLKKAVRVSSVTSTSKAIKIQYDSVRIPAESRSSKNDLPVVEVATLTLDWKTAYSEQDYSGKIIVKYKNGRGKTEIPYYITVVEGGISYNASTTRYFINEKLEDMKSRSVVIRNDFLTPLALMNISLPVEAQKYFQITNFKPGILKPKEELNVFSLKMKPGVSISNLRINSHVSLKTNISDFEFPLLSYNGKLELHLPYKSKDNSLDLGLLSLESKKDTYILLLNKNPIKVTMKQVFTSLPSSQVSVIGCGSGDYTHALLQESYANMTKCTYLRPSEYAVLRLTIKTSNSEGQIWGDISVTTQYEQMSIPVHFKIAQGKLEVGPDRLVFDQCFPGKICSHPLRVHSTFTDPMVIEDIVSVPPDKRLSSKHTGHIMARTTKIIGHLYLDPNIGCSNECYAGMLQDSSSQWLKTLTLPKLTTDFDLNLVNVFYNRYLNQTSNGLSKWQNLTVRLDTSEVKGHIFKTRVKMSWPSIILENGENRSVFNFPLTQVGNTTYRNLTIRNPSSYNLVVQLVMDKLYPNVELLYEGLPPNFIPNYADVYKKQKHDFFFKETFRKKRGQFLDLTNVKAHDESIPILLAPGENFTLTIGFRATEAVLNSAHLFLRNNLTVLEVVRLNGQGAYPNFKFGNRKPGSTLPLVFELTEKHLKDCEREKNRKYPAPNLSVKRSFTARNTGDITVSVNNFYINGLPCEGYGFKVLNCEPFALLPNGTKKIDIAFTPDFTLAKITRNLILDTSLNLPVNYTLVTTIPSYYLALCASVLTRPVWEQYLYYLAIALMCVILTFVVIMPVVESERILKHAMGILSRQSPLTEPLDLRLIGAQTKSEMRSQKYDDEDANATSEGKHSEKSGSVKNNSANVDSLKQIKEPEKYTVLVPTTGKGKRKLSKRNSNEISDSHEMQKKNWSDPQKSTKIKLHDAPNNKSAHIVDADLLNCKKTTCSNNNKAVRAKPDPKKCSEQKPLETPQYEEETSSTTTESSNNEEVDVKCQKVLIKKVFPPLPKPDFGKIVSDQEVKSSAKGERKKSQPKMLPKNNNKENRGELSEGKNDGKPKDHKSKGNKGNRERKEKQGVNKKQSDKSTNKVGECSTTSSSPTIRTSPSISTSNIWGENKASFSAVVAKTEIVGTNSQPRPLTQPQIAKPTVFVEPYKKPATELGPIGSRRLEYLQDSMLSDRQMYPSTTQEDQYKLSSSFFTEAHNLAVESANAYFDTNDCWRNTNSVSPMMNLIQLNNAVSQANSLSTNTISQPSEIQGDPWGSNSSGFWDYSPPRDDLQNAQLLQSQQQNGYLWGSSSVWQPWSPDLQRTSTRTPPGFGPTNRDLEERFQQQQTYNPLAFGISNIWAQHQQSNPWNYPQGQ